MHTLTAYQALAPGAPLRRAQITRRDLRPDDITVSVTHCGVCHSDLHALRDPGGTFPLVPGHEFVGHVSAVGPALTYGGSDRHDGSLTQGAYSSEYVVRERFAYHRPAHLDPAGVAPLMCAGITVWEPLRRWNVGSGTRVGVVGLGGLGHLAVKLAAALGAHVSVFTTSAAKADDATRLGAHHTVVSTDTTAMTAAQGSCDLVLDCVSAPHDLAPYLRVLALDGTLCSLGHLGTLTIETIDLLIGRKSLASSGSGGHRYTRDLLDFAGRHGITADVEVIPSAQLNAAQQRLAAGDVRYRFVLDLSDIDVP